VSSLSIIGIKKVDYAGSDVYITPTLADATAIARCGADVVALDATDRPRPTGVAVADIVATLHKLGVVVMADVSTADEGEAAVALGVDLVATTLGGYTPSTTDIDKSEPSLRLLRALRELPVPVIAEGRIWTTEHVAQCFACGAHAVIIGSAISSPELITRRFVAAATRQNMVRVDRGTGRRTAGRAPVQSGPESRDISTPNYET
jgi:N-acylglucosamine-6-phosphate 2-epimerase